MGEQADYLIDDMFDNYWDNQEYDPDYLDHIVFIKQPIKCKFCGVANYHWAQDENNKWRLHTPTGKLHTCNKYQPKEVMSQK